MSAIESNVMVNPINDSNSFKVLDSENRLQRIQSSAAKDSQQTEEGSQVNLSTISKQVANLKEFISSAPEIDNERVEFLKDELASGRYQMNSRQIATKMLNDI